MKVDIYEALTAEERVKLYVKALERHDRIEAQRLLRSCTHYYATIPDPDFLAELLRTKPHTDLDQLIDARGGVATAGPPPQYNPVMRWFETLSNEQLRAFAVYFEIMHNELDQIDRHPEQHTPIENASVALRLIDCAFSTAQRLIANEDFTAMQAVLDRMRAALQAVAPDFSILGWSKQWQWNQPPPEPLKLKNGVV